MRPSMHPTVYYSQMYWIAYDYRSSQLIGISSYSSTRNSSGYEPMDLDLYISKKWDSLSISIAGELSWSLIYDIFLYIHAPVHLTCISPAISKNKYNRSFLPA